MSALSEAEVMDAIVTELAGEAWANASSGGVLRTLVGTIGYADHQRPILGTVDSILSDVSEALDDAADGAPKGYSLKMQEAARRLMFARAFLESALRLGYIAENSEAAE